MFELKCINKCYKFGRIRFVDDVVNVEDKKTAEAMEAAKNWEIISVSEPPVKKAATVKKTAPAKKADKVQDPLAS